MERASACSAPIEAVLRQSRARLSEPHSGLCRHGAAATHGTGADMPPFRLTIRVRLLCGNGVTILCRKGASRVSPIAASQPLRAAQILAPSATSAPAGCGTRPRRPHARRGLRWWCGFQHRQLRRHSRPHPPAQRHRRRERPVRLVGERQCVLVGQHRRHPRPRQHALDEPLLARGRALLMFATRRTSVCPQLSGHA